jgi:hypothetical protein
MPGVLTPGLPAQGHSMEDLNDMMIFARVVGDSGIGLAR